MKTSTEFPELLQTFFIERLMHQRQASPHTIASYRDTFRLLLRFAQERLAKDPSRIRIEDLEAPFIGTFISHVERERGNSPRTRNVRLAAIHSFFRYIALNEPSHCALAQRILAIPTKRFDRKSIEFLTEPEMDALLAAPDQGSWGGRRDYTLMLTALQTGLRGSELIGLWLGHESVETTGIYLHADMAMKERALAKTTPPKTRRYRRFRPDDRLLAFLKSL